MYTEWNAIYNNVKIYFEFPTGPSEDRLSHGGMIHNGFYFSETLPDESNADSLEVIFMITLFLHFLFYLTKVLFELSLGISKFTNFLELGHLAALFVVVLMFIIEFVTKNIMFKQVNFKDMN